MMSIARTVIYSSQEEAVQAIGGQAIGGQIFVVFEVYLLDLGCQPPACSTLATGGASWSRFLLCLAAYRLS